MARLGIGQPPFGAGRASTPIGCPSHIKSGRGPPTLQKPGARDVTDYFPPDDIHAHFLRCLLSIGSARQNRGKLGEGQNVYWLPAMVDRNEPPLPPSKKRTSPPPPAVSPTHPPITPPLPAAKRLIHVWLSDVNSELFLEMLVRIWCTRGAPRLAGLPNSSQTAEHGGGGADCFRLGKKKNGQKRGIMRKHSRYLWPFTLHTCCRNRGTTLITYHHIIINI